MTAADDPRIHHEPSELSDEDLAQVLSYVYRKEPIPPCRVCGGPLSVQRIGGHYATEWGCSPYQDDPNNPDLVSLKPGRSIADDHFGQSRHTQYRVGDPRVLELVRRFEEARK